MKTEFEEMPRLPAIGEYVRGIGKLLAMEELAPKPPPPPEHDYIFEEITAHVELRLNGEQVQTFSAFWDYVGRESSVVDATEQAKEFAARHHLGPSSDLDVVVIRTAAQIRKQPRNNPNNYDKRFADFNPLEIGCCRDLPDPTETIVWSSKSPPS